MVLNYVWIAFFLKVKIKVSKPIKQAWVCFVFLIIAVFVSLPMHPVLADNQAEDQEVKQRLEKIKELEEKYPCIHCGVKGKLKRIVQLEVKRLKILNF